MSAPSSLPNNLKYTKDHEWAKIEGKTVTIGITDHAQSSLGDIVFVDLPQPGKLLTAGQPFGNVESVKAVSELFSPITGKVTEVNEALADSPNAINSDPYGNAWLIKMELTDISSAEKLLSSNQYSELLAKI